MGQLNHWFINERHEMIQCKIHRIKHKQVHRYVCKYIPVEIKDGTFKKNKNSIASVYRKLI